MGTHQWNVRVEDLVSIRLSIVSQASGQVVFKGVVGLDAKLGTQPIYVCGVVAPSILLCAKLSFFLLYLQIFRPIKALRLCIYAGALVTAFVHISAMVAFIVFDTPHTGQSFESQQTPSAIREGKIVCTVLGAAGTAIDWYILVLPIAAVSKLQLGKRRKIGVILVFLTGTM